MSHRFTVTTPALRAAEHIRAAAVAVRTVPARPRDDRDGRKPGAPPPAAVTAQRREVIRAWLAQPKAERPLQKTLAYRLGMSRVAFRKLALSVTPGRR